jgi:hypothetical protein
VSKSSIEIDGDKDKIFQFDVTFNCPALMKQSKYFDTVFIQLSDESSSIFFEYIMVCDVPQLKSFDINFVVLFLMAIAIVVIAIKTP